MKLTKYFMPLAAIALLASCSDDKIVDQPGGEVVNKGEVLTAQFKVSLPSVDGTRADSFQGFEGAEKDTYESTVKNVQIFIFKKSGNTEADYYCIGKSELWSPSMANENTDVEKRATITVQFTPEEGITLPTNSKSSGNYFGLAVVNVPDQGEDEDVFKLPAPGGDPTSSDVTKKGTTFGAWSETAQEYSFVASDKSYFTMTNAPQWVKGTGEGKEETPASTIFTLVPLNDATFAVSPGEPSGTAGTFYVQRGVAKVRLGLATGTGAPTSFHAIPTQVNSTHRVWLDKWDIDVTNKTSFPVQVVTGITWPATSTWMFLTQGTQSAEISHLWWGKDPNYNSATTKLSTPAIEGELVDFNYNDNPSQSIDLEDKNYDYCLENTMEPKQMLQDRTTRVIFKGYYSLDGTFDEESGKAHSFIVDPRNDKAIDVESMLLTEGIASAGRVALSSVVNTEDFDDTDDIKASDYLTEEDTKEGKEKLTNLEAVAIMMGYNFREVDFDKIMVDFYPNGETFYVARIRHFNDDETPLGANYKGASTYNDNHLGRYGVLRNNIYDVLIKDVKGFGSPTYPDPVPDEGDPDPDDPTDPDKYNINVVINVLKWAVRQYDYTLD